MTKKRTKIFRNIIIVIISILLIIFLLNIGNFYNFFNNTKFDKTKLQTVNTKLNLYAGDDEMFSNSSILGNKVVSLDELPEYVPGAFISIEDKDFYKHNGLNYKRIVKAFITNLTNKSIMQGASTISQQLIKNTHLSQDKTIERKVKEMYLTKQLENECSKEEILQTYLNVIYFGNSSYGIENASLTYFDKSAKDLTINEACGLAGIIKSPRNYSPIYNYENFINRKNLVAKNMFKDGKINENKYDEIVATNIKISENASTTSQRNIYENACIDEACKILDISEKDLSVMGYKIYTALDATKQDKIMQVVNSPNYRIKNRNDKYADTCMVSINARTGGIEGFYGNGCFDFGSYKRQPGSAIKPVLVYGPALEKNMITPLTKINNSPLDIDGYSPANIGSNEKKYVSVQEALSKSLNIPTVRVLDYVGIEDAKKFAERFGVKFDKEDNNYAIALGGMTYGMNIKDLAGSYTPFAHNGYYIKPHFINKIVNSTGQTLYKYHARPTKVISSDTTFLMNDMLRNATKDGTSRRLKNLPFDIAGKTGTVGVTNTKYNTDAWSVGYTSRDIVCSWIGNGDGNSDSTLDGSNNGGTYATSMINDAVSTYYDADNYPTFKVPSSVKKVNIDAYKYNNENLIIESDENLKDRYVISAYFSKRNLPEKKSFSEPQINFNSVINDEQDAEISFNVIPYLQYHLYRVIDNNQYEIYSVENQYCMAEFTDTELPSGKEFYYRLIVSNIEESTNSVEPIQEESEKFIIDGEEQKKWFY